jgi:hypothetical protein
MTYYTKQGITSCQIAGAVTEAALHDLRVNLFTFSGFPQVFVSELADNVFTISLSWKESSETFELTMAEAVAAVKKFKSKSGHDVNIFERVQKSLASLEAKVSRGE